MIDYDNNNKPRRIYNPVAAYLNNPITGNMINIRNNTPLPMRLKSVEMKGNRVYDEKRDLGKFSQPVVYDQKKRWGGVTNAPNRTKVFKMLKNYTNMAKYADEYVTGKKPYSIGNFPKNSKWYVPLTLNNMKKYKNISTTNKLPPLTKGDRRWARREAHRYTNDGAEEPFTAVLNAWNKRNRMKVIKNAGVKSVLPSNVMNMIAEEATKNYYNYKTPRRSRKTPWDYYTGNKKRMDEKLKKYVFNLYGRCFTGLRFLSLGSASKSQGGEIRL